MIDLSHKNEWQHIDPTNGLIFPWYTKSFLDELATWDLKDRVVFEYGLGASSLWWADKCKKLYGVESNKEYFESVYNKIGNASSIVLDESPFYFLSIFEWNKQFDIIVIDGIYRDECIAPALTCLKSGGKLIIDNWLQPSVHIASRETQDLLIKYPYKVYKQEGHIDWKTAVFTI